MTCVCMLLCWMCEVEPMCVDADGVGCGRRGALLSPGWEDVYMDVDGVGCGRRGALLSPGWEDVYMDVAVAWLRGCVYGCGWYWGWMAKRVAVAWLRIFFIFCLRRGGGYMYS